MPCTYPECDVCRRTCCVVNDLNSDDAIQELTLDTIIDHLDSGIEIIDIPDFSMTAVNTYKKDDMETLS
jgi:hypothetical protein